MHISEDKCRGKPCVCHRSITDGKSMSENKWFGNTLSLDIGLISVIEKGQTQGLPLHLSSDIGLIPIIRNNFK
jgi:hypothetical protein